MLNARSETLQIALGHSQSAMCQGDQTLFVQRVGQPEIELYQAFCQALRP